MNPRSQRLDLGHRRNPRSLFGLREALTRQHRDCDAQLVRQEFKTAWMGSDIDLEVDDL